MRVTFWGIAFHAMIVRSRLDVGLSGTPTSLRLLVGAVTILWGGAVFGFVRMSRGAICGLRSVWNSVRPLGWSWTTLTMLVHGVGQASALEDLFDFVLLLGVGVFLGALLLAQAWVQAWAR